MGTTKLTHEQLADKIDGEKDALTGKRVARYELAYKPEVKAFVDRRCRQLSDAIEEELNDVRAEIRSYEIRTQENADAIIDLRAQIAELELTWWQRTKRAIGDFRDGFIEGLRPPTPVIVLPWGDEAALSANEDAALAYEAVLDLEQQSIEIAEAIRAIQPPMAGTMKTDAQAFRDMDDLRRVEIARAEADEVGIEDEYPPAHFYDPSKFRVGEKVDLCPDCFAPVVRSPYSNIRYDVDDGAISTHVCAQPLGDPEE